MKQKKFFFLFLLSAVFFAIMTYYEKTPKKITVNVLPTMEVIPGGNLIGIKLYSRGVIVVGQSKVQDMNGNWLTMYPDGTFKAGDYLLKINEYEVESVEEVSTIVNNIGEKQIELTYERNGTEIKTLVNPVKSFEDGRYKIGLWVRDGAMGVGTVTFFSPEYNCYAALGHGISDDTSKELIKIEKGEIYDASLISITKGRNEVPGEMKGFLNEEKLYGDIDGNTTNGIYGNYSGEIENDMTEIMSIASIDEVKLGNAKLLCIVDESQKVESFDVEITKISPYHLWGTQGMVVKVTDEELLRKTGGIIQGMSGSPMIQNGKLIGAITHVYVNDPTKGYAIFAETMMNEIANMYGRVLTALF